jgi:hypothetical protein
MVRASRNNKDKISKAVQIVLLSIGLNLFVLCPAGAVRTDESIVRKALQAEIGKVILATKRKDIKTLLAQMTPDFTIHYPDGTVENFAQQKRSNEAQLRLNTSFREWRDHIDKLHVNGNVAVSIESTYVSSIVVDLKGKKHTLIDRGKQRSTWILTKAGWKRKHIDLLDLSAVVDGQLIHPYAHSLHTHTSRQ